MSEEKVLTNGEFRVGISFNPGKHEAVEKLKRSAADLIDLVDAEAEKHRKELFVELSQAEDEQQKEALRRRVSEVGRLAALANTAIEHAAMDAVKAVTK